MFKAIQNLEFQCLKKTEFRIPMFGKSQNSEFQCLKTEPKFRFSMFLKKDEFRILMLRKR